MLEKIFICFKLVDADVEHSKLNRKEKKTNLKKTLDIKNWNVNIIKVRETKVSNSKEQQVHSQL